MLHYRSELLRFLHARRVATDEAEDIVQDLYIKVRTLETGPVAEPRAYLYKMAANLLFDRRRAAIRRANRERIWVETELGPEQEVDEHPSAEQALSTRQELAVVTAAIAGLPERTAQILRRYRIDGDAQRDIAAGLGISLSAVEKHLQRAYRVVIEARTRLSADIAHSRRPSE